MAAVLHVGWRRGIDHALHADRTGLYPGKEQWGRIKESKMYYEIHKATETFR
jgi:hypothetical protein